MHPLPTHVAPVVQQAPLLSVSPSINLHDAVQAFLLLLDWRSEVVWLNPPWALLPDVLCKLRAERPAAVLLVPVWPSQMWWPSLLALEVFHVDLSPPKFSVCPLHKGKTEPFLNTGVRLRTVFCRPGSKQ